MCRNFSEQRINTRNIVIIKVNFAPKKMLGFGFFGSQYIFQQSELNFMQKLLEHSEPTTPIPIFGLWLLFY